MQPAMNANSLSPSNPKREIVAAFSARRLAVVASVLTIFAGTAQVAKDVLESRTLNTAMAADEGVPQNLVTSAAGSRPRASQREIT